jgi:hypothetical protein
MDLHWFEFDGTSAYDGGTPAIRTRFKTLRVTALFNGLEYGLETIVERADPDAEASVRQIMEAEMRAVHADLTQTKERPNG